MYTGAFALVLTTIPGEVDAAGLAETLIRERLAACVSVLPPMESVYRWQDGVDRATERQLLIKTTAEKTSALQQRIKTLHPYDVPELIVVPISGGSDDYLGWLKASCSS